MKTIKIVFLSLIIISSAVFSSCAKDEKTQKINELIKELGAEPMSEKAPVLSLPSVDGSDELSLAQFKEELVVLSVWVSWCGYCKQEAPLMSQLAKLTKHVPGIQVVGLSRDEKLAEAIDFINQFDLEYPNMLDPKGEAHNATGVLQARGTPTTFYISPEGRVIGKAVGFHAFDPQEKLITLKKLSSALRN